MWSVYLELLGIPLALFLWIGYRRIFLKRGWTEIQPDFLLALFVTAVWILVYFILLH